VVIYGIELPRSVFHAVNKIQGQQTNHVTDFGFEYDDGKLTISNIGTSIDFFASK